MYDLDDKSTVVCHCAGITVQQLVDEIEAGAETVEAVMDNTTAGMYCGSCTSIVKDVFEKYKKGE